MTGNQVDFSRFAALERQRAAGTAIFKPFFAHPNQGDQLYYDLYGRWPTHSLGKLKPMVAAVRSALYGSRA